MENLEQQIEKVFQKAFDYKEAIKRINRTEDEVNQLRELVKKDKKIPPYVSDKHLLIFLSTDSTVAEALAKIKLFYHLKYNSPEVFRNRDPYSKEIETTFDNTNFLYLPVTPDGYSVVYSSLKNYSVSSFVLDSISKAFFMTAGPQKGIIFLIDMAGGKLFHLSRINMKTIKMGLKFAMDGCPEKIIAFHILNAVPFYELIIQIMKPFSRKELRLLLNLHYADIDWEHFYANHIPKSCLPSDYGGDLESIEALSKKNLQHLKDLKDYYELDEKQVYECVAQDSEL